MKKVIIVGASGTIGSTVAKALQHDHHIVRAGRSGPDLVTDASNPEQLAAAFAELGSIDALVSCIGHVPFTPFDKTSKQEFDAGLLDKFGHQANLVRAALPHISPGGSITLTSGILSEEPIIGGSCAAAANGALNAFVKVFAAEQLGRIRVNIVSPSVVEDSVEKYGAFFDGIEATSMKSLAAAYRRTLSGPITGQTLFI